MGQDLDVLLERAAEGDRGAFAQFYDATSPQAYRLALAVAGDQRAAEQVVVRAYTTAWRLSPARSATVSPHCWILGLVQGTARDQNTRPARRTAWRIRGLAEPG